METLLSLFSQEYFYATMRMASPLILIATGEVILQRSGIINLGMESMVIVGAFLGVLGSYLTGSGWLGVLIAMAGGCLVGLLFGICVITLRTSQSVTGIAFNVIGMGITAVLNRVIWGVRYLPVEVNGIDNLHIPFLSDIPFIGPVLFNHSPIVYFAYILVGLSIFLLYKTSVGLKIRALGEDPWAAASIGINVFRWRYSCLIFSGSMAALGGTILSLSQMNIFVERMSGGRGYFALAAVILGQWHPIGATLGSLLFGAGQALQMRLQVFGVPIASDLLLVFPFVLALIAVIIFHGESSSKPAALSKPYIKEQSL